jgi:hypothetical protein
MHLPDLENLAFQVEIIETKINDLLQYINNAMDMTRTVSRVSIVQGSML